MKNIDSSALSVCDLGKWSGGGQGLLGNIEFARQLYPEKFSVDGVPVYLRNIVPFSVLLEKRFVYMPQNAWAWHGPAFSFGEVRRKKLLRIGSEVAMSRANRLVRIGPMVPDRRGLSKSILSNVLDPGFDTALAEANSMDAPSWLPLSEYIIVPGSLWSYRNIRAVIRGYEIYRQHGGNRELVIVGSKSKGSGSSSVLNKCIEMEHVHLITRHVKRSELVFAIKNASCCVLSSLVEASPVTLLEAAAVSTGIVAWNIPAYRFMADNESLEGVVFVESETELAEGMRQTYLGKQSLIATCDYRKARRNKWVEDFLDACLG